ncbi:MAG: VanZ family protein [Burkholderiaceae bacterium]|jgi:VanZ family protein
MARLKSQSAQEDRRFVLRILAGVWCLVLMSLSLYPFEGWRWPNPAPWEFLIQPLPRYRTPFDLWTNLLAYVPLGFLIAGARPLRGRTWVSMLIAILLATLLSLGMEMAQTLLPSRRAQWLDTLANLSGSGLGALLWHGLFGRLSVLPLSSNPRGLPAAPSWYRLGPLLGLLLIFAFAQASPMPIWLSMGLSPLWGFGPWVLVANESAGHILLEALSVGFSLAGLFLLIICTISPHESRWGRWLQQHPAGAIAMTLLTAIALRVTWVVLLGSSPGEVLIAWMTPGVQAGLVLAGLISAAVIALGGLSRILLLIALVTLSFVLSQAVTLLGPLTQGVWASGPWFNLRGLAQSSAALWPLLTLGWAAVLLLHSHNRRL